MANDARLTTWVKQHPWGWAIVSTIAVFLWGVILFGLGVALWWIVPLGLVIGAMNLLVWRPGGPGARWNDELRRRYPPK